MSNVVMLIMCLTFKILNGKNRTGLNSTPGIIGRAVSSESYILNVIITNFLAN